MCFVKTSAALAALFALAAAPAGAATRARAGPALGPDVAALIDDAPNGDTSALEAALPNVRGADASLLAAGIAAARLDRVGVDKALDAYFAAKDGDVRRQAIAWSIRGSSAFAAADYGGAARAIDAWQQLPAESRKPDEAESLAQMQAIARALANEPRQAVLGGTPGAAPTRRDKVGLLRADVQVNGAVQAAVLDTGANLSLVSASTAKKLGLRMLRGTTSVRSATSKAVPTRLAIADRLTIAGVTLSNVVFLVMDDSQLSFPVPGGYSIDAIVGFPVFRALGRIRFDRTGTLSAGEAAGPAGEAGNLHVNVSDMFVLAKVNSVGVALHLDTGSSRTALHSPFAARHPAMLAGLPAASSNVSGAGGAAISVPAVLLRPARIEIGGRTVELPELMITIEAARGKVDGNLGTLGQDVLTRFASYTIDFPTMSFALGAPQ